MAVRCIQGGVLCVVEEGELPLGALRLGHGAQDLLGIHQRGDGASGPACRRGECWAQGQDDSTLEVRAVGGKHGKSAAPAGKR